MNVAMPCVDLSTPTQNPVFELQISLFEVSRRFLPGSSLDAPHLFTRADLIRADHPATNGDLQ
jgi:hypothetical protein